MKKVAGKGAGAGLLRDIPLMLEITRAVVKAVNTPVTAKTRLGWDKENLVITTLAEQLQDCGVQALTIHGRTRSQMYTGDADWSLIGSPQIWCSDNTDAIDRLKIQYGTSFGYPISAMGAHVSVCPNHQSGRITPFETRGTVASSGTFGYELDLMKMSP